MQRVPSPQEGKFVLLVFLYVSFRARDKFMYNAPGEDTDHALTKTLQTGLDIPGYQQEAYTQ